MVSSDPELRKQHVDQAHKNENMRRRGEAEEYPPTGTKTGLSWPTWFEIFARPHFPPELDHGNAPWHLSYMTHLDDREERFLLNLVHRGGEKTTRSQWYYIYCLVELGLIIVFMSSVMSLVVDTHDFMVKTLKYDPMILKTYGRIIVSAGRGNGIRTVYSVEKGTQPAFLAVTSGTNVTGKHPDIWATDDFQATSEEAEDKKAATPARVRQLDRTFRKTIVPAMSIHPFARFLSHGTRKDLSDIYGGWIDLGIFGVYSKMWEEGETGFTYVPPKHKVKAERFSWKHFYSKEHGEYMKREMGIEAFEAEMNQRPLKLESNMYRAEQVIWVEPEVMDALLGKRNTVTFIDPGGFGDENHGAALVCFFIEHEKMHVVATDLIKTDLQAVAKQLAAWYLRWRMKVTYVEAMSDEYTEFILPLRKVLKAKFPALPIRVLDFRNVKVDKTVRLKSGLDDLLDGIWTEWEMKKEHVPILVMNRRNPDGLGFIGELKLFPVYTGPGKKKFDRLDALVAGWNERRRIARVRPPPPLARPIPTI
jgi:hypothetical protein